MYKEWVLCRIAPFYFQASQCLSVWQCVKKYPSVSECTKVYQSAQGCMRVYESVSNSTRVYQGVVRCTTDVPQCTKVYHSVECQRFVWRKHWAPYFQSRNSKRPNSCQGLSYKSALCPGTLLNFVSKRGNDYYAALRHFYFSGFT